MDMTAREMSLLIGQRRFALLGKDRSKLTVEVEILDVRTGHWGRTDAQITPVSGRGSTWVNIDSLSPVEEDDNVSSV
jgi:hypothetical protein